MRDRVSVQKVKSICFPFHQHRLDYREWNFCRVSSCAPIEFDITVSGDDYIDFAISFLHVKVKIERANGTALDAADTVGPVNNLLHGLFSQVDVSLNGTLITNSTNTYPYRAYLENLLSYGPTAKGSQLTSEMFYKDESGKFDRANPSHDDEAMKNKGLPKRTVSFARSKEVNLVGRLHTDIFFNNDTC